WIAGDKDPTRVTSSPSRIQVMPKAVMTRTWNRSQGRRSRRAGMAVVKVVDTSMTEKRRGPSFSSLSLETAARAARYTCTFMALRTYALRPAMVGLVHLLRKEREHDLIGLLGFRQVGI